MSLKKKLYTNETVDAWIHNGNGCNGISVALYGQKAFLSVESTYNKDGSTKRIVFDKEKAEKCGFEIVFGEVK